MSISHRITTLLDLINTVVSRLKKVKDGNAEQYNVLEEILDIRNILIKLEINANIDKWKDTMNVLAMAEGPFDWLTFLLNGVNTKLSFTKKLFLRAKWPFGKIEIILILFLIKRIHSCFNVGLQNEHV